MPAVIDLTYSNFDKTISSRETPCLVCFYAPWDSISAKQLELLDTMAEKYPNVQVARVNVSFESQLPVFCNVSTYPTTLLYKDGHVVAHSMKYAGTGTLEKMLSVLKEG